MADNEIKAQIDKLRKTRPARALQCLPAGAVLTGSTVLSSVLEFLRDDLKEEARLLEVSKIKGAVTIMKDRNAVAGWLELFVLQLGREGEDSAPSERLSPSPELGEHRPSEFGEDWATNPGPGGRCAVGNVHDESTLKCPCGYHAVDLPDSGAMTLDPPIAGPATLVVRRPGELDVPMTIDAGDTITHVTSGSVADYLSGVSDEIPGAREKYERLPDGSITISDAAAYIGEALAPAEQAAHDTIDRELNHVTADALPDPFAPIPAPTYGPRTPPGGRQVTALDLLTPMDASLLPVHVSFSQLTTVADCGVKFRLQRVEQLRQVPQWANVGGSAFHAAVERIETVHAQTGAPMPQESIVATCWDDALTAEIERVEADSSMPRDTFRASQQGKENYDWWRVEGALMLQRYVDWRQGAGEREALLSTPGTKLPMLEWETTYDVNGVPFKTILDSVWVVADGASPATAIIKDWKTGSMTPDDRQLCTQAWGLRMAGWTGPVLVQFFDARKGAFSEPFDPFERMTWDDVRYFVLSGDAQRRLPIPSARPSDFCGGCPVAYACPIMAQRKAPKVAK